MECKGCRYFKPDRDTGMGLCRKEAPRWVPGDNSYRGRWPVVRKNDWCGEFKEIKRKR